MASILVVVNPVAGKGRGVARALALRDRLTREHAVRVVETTGRGSATALAECHGAEADRVIAVGGDGTLNEVLTGLLRLGSSPEARPALGFLSGGTANVATRAFGFTRDPVELARALPGAVGRPVDVGIARIGGEERPFLLWCGAGIDAVVIDRLNSARTGRMGVTGLALKAPRVLAALARYSGAKVQATADGAPMPPAASVILANVGAIAFGGTVHAGASPFDGQVDVVAIDRATPLDLVGLGARLLLSSLTSARGVAHCLATTVELRSEGEVPVQIDGEPVGHLPVSVRVERGGIRLLVA